MAKNSEQAPVHQSCSQVSSSRCKSPVSAVWNNSTIPHSMASQAPPLASVAAPSQQLEDMHGQLDVWLEAMRASSPPCLHRNDEDNGQFPYEDVAEAQYRGWVMRDTVRKVAALFPTAIITGRRRDKVYEFVHLGELYYAGSHGMDIMGPVEDCNGFRADGLKSKSVKGNDVVLFQPPSEYLPLMDEVCEWLKEKAKKYHGARVDHNKYCATLHFRCVKEEDWISLAKEVQLILEKYPELTLTQGRKVLELRPNIEWHKGKALEFLLKSLGLDSFSEVLPIYIGDDRTDEDAFQVLKDRGFGCSILVSKVAKETCALYSLKDPGEVMDFLQHLVVWKLEDQT